MDRLLADAPPKGTPISMNQGAKRYGFSQPTVMAWREKGQIATIKEGKGPGSKTLVDEHDLYVIAMQLHHTGERLKPGTRTDRLLANIA